MKFKISKSSFVKKYTKLKNVSKNIALKKYDKALFTYFGNDIDNVGNKIFEDLQKWANENQFQLKKFDNVNEINKNIMTKIINDIKSCNSRGKFKDKFPQNYFEDGHQHYFLVFSENGLYKILLNYSIKIDKNKNNIVYIENICSELKMGLYNQFEKIFFDNGITQIDLDVTSSSLSYWIKQNFIPEDEFYNVEDFKNLYYDYYLKKKDDKRKNNQIKHLIINQIGEENNKENNEENIIKSIQKIIIINDDVNKDFQKFLSKRLQNLKSISMKKINRNITTSEKPKNNSLSLEKSKNNSSTQSPQRTKEKTPSPQNNHQYNSEKYFPEKTCDEIFTISNDDEQKFLDLLRNLENIQDKRIKFDFPFINIRNKNEDITINSLLKLKKKIKNCSNGSMIQLFLIIQRI